MAKTKVVTELSWRNGVPVTIAAADAHKEFEVIRKANHGQLEADTVVKAAKAKRNPLHPEFEWDDKAAANEHRKERARLLLRSIMVVNMRQSQQPHRVYEVVDLPATEEQPARRYYGTMEDVMADPDTRQALLDRALGELQSFQRRFIQLQELAVVMGAINAVLETTEA